MSKKTRNTFIILFSIFTTISLTLFDFKGGPPLSATKALKYSPIVIVVGIITSLVCFLTIRTSSLVYRYLYYRL